jgi:hypothetical protein
VVIQGQRIYRIGVNYSEMEVSDEYTNSFRLTSVKMEELLSMAGPYFAPGNKLSHTLSEKQLLKIALHWLGIYEDNIIQKVTCLVYLRPVYGQHIFICL